jgi:hypothetical protein
MPYGVVVGYKHFGGPCCLHLQGDVTGDGKKGIDTGPECMRVAVF